MAWKSSLFAAVVAITCTAAVAGPPPTNLAQPVVTDYQSRSYPIAARLAFNSALSALQDMGYADIQANPEAGTINASVDSKAKTILNFFWDFGKKKWTQKAQVLVEDQGVGSTVRLNLIVGETKQRQHFGFWGSPFSDAELVRAAEPYIDFYHQLDLEVARRGGAVQRAVEFTPDAYGRIDLGGVRLRPAQTVSGYCVDAGAGYVGTGAANMPAVSSARPLCDNMPSR